MRTLRMPKQLKMSLQMAATSAANALSIYHLQAGVVFVFVVCAVLFVSSGQAERLATNHSTQSGATMGLRAGSPDIPPHAPGYLGILFGNLTNEQAMLLHIKDGRGVEIVMVDHDGPAGKAGLRPHDVILSMNGQPIASADDLRRMIHDAGVGAAASLVLIRDGAQVTVNTQLAYRGEVEREAAARIATPGPADAGDDPDDEAFGSDPALGASGRGPGFLSEMIHITPFTGMVMEAMEPQLAGFFGCPAGQGLLVESVAQGSPAERAGLKAGDVVLRVDSVGVKTTGEWARRLHASKGKPVVLTVLRERRERTMTLQPEFKHRSRLEWPTGVDVGAAPADFA